MNEDEEDDFDEEDEEGEKINYDDFFKFFKNANIDFGSAFKDLGPFKDIADSGFFKDIFQNIMKDLLPRMKELLPQMGDLSDLSKLKPKELMKMLWKNRDKIDIHGPIMYGFNMTIGPDGKPEFSKFGNVQRETDNKKVVKKHREPLTEVTEEDDQVVIIAEMPGIKKDDIELKSTETSLTIIANSDDSSRQYKKTVNLPVPVDPDHAKARYQNGILEVRLNKI